MSTDQDRNALQNGSIMEQDDHAGTDVELERDPALDTQKDGVWRPKPKHYPEWSTRHPGSGPAEAEPAIPPQPWEVSHSDDEFVGPATERKQPTVPLLLQRPLSTDAAIDTGLDDTIADKSKNHGKHHHKHHKKGHSAREHVETKKSSELGARPPLAALELAPGQSYLGEVDGGLTNANGFGVATTFEGGQFAGCWRSGQRHGSGTQRYASGDVYEGEWVNGVEQGFGVRTDASGMASFAGEWSQGRRQGHGCHSWSDGTKYSGHFEDGVFHGHGVLHVAPSTKLGLTGRAVATPSQFPLSACSGAASSSQSGTQGTFPIAMSSGPPERMRSGEKYEGEFADGCRHGHGVWTTARGEVVLGEWASGQLHGVAVRRCHGGGGEYAEQWYHGSLLEAQPLPRTAVVWSNPLGAVWESSQRAEKAAETAREEASLGTEVAQTASAAAMRATGHARAAHAASRDARGVQLQHGTRLALRSNGTASARQFLSLKPGGLVCADATRLTEREIFTLETRTADNAGKEDSECDETAPAPTSGDGRHFALRWGVTQALVTLDISTMKLSSHVARAAVPAVFETVVVGDRLALRVVGRRHHSGGWQPSRRGGYVTALAGGVVAVVADSSTDGDGASSIGKACLFDVHACPQTVADEDAALGATGIAASDPSAWARTARRLQPVLSQIPTQRPAPPRPRIEQDPRPQPAAVAAASAAARAAAVASGAAAAAVQATKVELVAMSALITKTLTQREQEWAAAEQAARLQAEEEHAAQQSTAETQTESMVPGLGADSESEPPLPNAWSWWDDAPVGTREPEIRSRTESAEPVQVAEATDVELQRTIATQITSLMTRAQAVVKRLTAVESAVQGDTGEQRGADKDVTGSKDDQQADLQPPSPEPTPPDASRRKSRKSPRKTRVRLRDVPPSHEAAQGIETGLTGWVLTTETQPN